MKTWEQEEMQRLRAEASCATVQRGAHIDSMPVQPALPPLRYQLLVLRDDLDAQGAMA